MLWKCGPLDIFDSPQHFNKLAKNYCNLKVVSPGQVPFFYYVIISKSIKILLFWSLILDKVASLLNCLRVVPLCSTGGKAVKC